MTRIKLGNIETDALPQSRGSFQTYATKYGVHAHKWPRPRGKQTQGYGLYRVQEFKNAVRCLPLIHDVMMQTCRNLSKGSEQTYRDIALSCMYGRFYEFSGPPGAPDFQSGTMQPNPQYILDLITKTPGSLLYRAEDAWYGLDPGLDGESLVLAGGMPAWQPLFPYSIPGATVLGRNKTEPAGPPHAVDLAGLQEILGLSIGTSAPTISFVNPGDLAVTYANQNGPWYTVGNLVFQNFRIVTSSFTHSTASGELIITGLPIMPSAGAAGSFARGAVATVGINAAGYTQWLIRAETNQQTARILLSGPNMPNLTATAAHTVSGTNIQIRGTLLYARDYP